MNCTPEELKYLILNVKEPLILKDFVKSDLLKWNLSDWGRILEKESLVFRCGTNSFTKSPQWERTTRTLKGSFKDFLKTTTGDGSEWLYFDYKYLREWFLNIDEIRNLDLGLTALGFPTITADDFTIWIGSKGAHTPCHADTYGCNLIFQIYGRKQWIVFSPETNLRPTRVPYEESSIYSKLNFFSPSITDFKGVGDCRKVVLNPGDVLLLPHKWWHYVENLETAISLNVWLPLPSDDKERLNESLVQLIVRQFAKDLPPEIKNILLNTNAEEQILKEPFESFVNTLNTCNVIYKNKIESDVQQKTKIAKCESNSKHLVEPDQSNFMEIVEKHDFIERIPKLSAEDFHGFLEDQRSRFSTIQTKIADAEGSREAEGVVKLVNCLTHPDVISLIRDKLLMQ